MRHKLFGPFTALFLAAVVLAASCTAMAAEDLSTASEPPFTVTVGPGLRWGNGLISVPVTAEHCPGIAGYHFAFAYDREQFELVEIRPAVQEVGTFASNPETDFPSVVWYHSEDIVWAEELFSIILRLRDGAATASHGITLRREESDVCNADLQDIPVLLDSNDKILPSGDASCDGVTDALDLQAIYHHIHGTDTLPPELLPVVDMNGDGEINVLDQQIIYRRCTQIV